ncbi:4-hydroxy-tetrahydrodipicolinate reductase [Devosia sp. ZB163]|uniref:4-hydroxy-tetrahydrodipicolinate reductase n=1 Tax=Devosia sp. ZB163 TaxID=3025938 RepID=UPI0023625435|nr:4-hydroxy-tetrahydrodipicolinate reductase [Devosia sp. ZB163]MDC9822603.1 4-hydroxy-tetrahydrodipicolinate reductase [Devosia sp. ZB163]
MSDLKVAVAGAGGRMGGANIRAIVATPGLTVHSAFDRSGAPPIGKDAGELAGVDALGVAITDNVEAALSGADAIIDFTAPANSVALANEAAKRGLIHIIGTTGCSEADDAAIAAAAANGARIVKDGNFSLGVNLLLGLVRQAAAALPDFDIEVLEMHHNKKVDAPSGTALMLGKAAARGRNVDLRTHSVRVRDGHTGAREAGSIGFATLRGGNVIGEHKVILAGPAERIELTHIADNRALFADGAMRAALWARDQRPGLYSMADVLGFN